MVCLSTLLFYLFLLPYSYLNFLLLRLLELEEFDEIILIVGNYVGVWWYKVTYFSYLRWSFFNSSVVPDLFFDLLVPSFWGWYHLTQNCLFFFYPGYLLLEIGILFFLIDHSQLKSPIQAFHKGPSSFMDLIVDTLNFAAHRVQLVLEELNYFVIAL